MARKVSLILSHWYHLIEGFQWSPQQFYEILDDAIAQRQIQNLALSRVTYREGGVFSARRLYYRVRRKEHLFDICAAPFGKGFFVSWWLGESPGFFWRMLLMLPFVGELLVRTFRPATYYQLDTALMFQQSVHSAVLSVVDFITKTNGLRLLTEQERKPILTSLFKR